MRRSVLRLLLLAPLAGCVVPTDPLRMAVYGPTTTASVAPAGHGLREGERIALVIRQTQVDPARLQGCIADAMRARLPAPGPALVTLDEAGAGRLLAGLPAEAGAALAEDVSGLGADWAVVVRDASTRVATPERDFGGSSGGGGGALGVYAGQRVDYNLFLEATVLDLRERRTLGRATAWYGAQGGGGVAAGIIGGAGIILPFILPVIRLPAGTSAMAICDAFGRRIGEALVQATTPREAPAAAAPIPGAPARP